MNTVIASTLDKATVPPLWSLAARKRDQLDSVTTLQKLKVPHSNQLDALARNRKGQHSIRINNQYRICFRWTDLGSELLRL